MVLNRRAQEQTVIIRSMLSNKSAPIRANAAFAIGQFGSEGKPAVPALVSALKDENVNVRLTVAKSLGAIGPDAKAAVPALAKLLDDDVGGVTINAAEALGQIGSAAVPVLAEKLSDPNLRALAASVLSEIGPDAKAAVPELVKLLGTDDDATRIEVLLAIAEIGPDAEAAIEPLLKTLRSPAAKGRAGAAYALAKIEAKSAIPVLKQTVKDKDELLRFASGWALVRFEPKNAEFVRIALPSLIKGLSHKIPVIRREVAEVLGMIGPAAKPAARELLRTLKDGNLEVRVEALMTLAEIDASDELVLTVAVKALQDDDPMFRYAGAYLLGRAGTKASSAIPELRQKLKSRDPFEKTVAAWAIVNIAPKPELIKTAVPILVEALNHERPTVRAKVAETLGRVGRNSARVRTALITATKDEDQEVREAATEALRKLDD